MQPSGNTPGSALTVMETPSSTFVSLKETASAFSVSSSEVESSATDSVDPAADSAVSVRGSASCAVSLDSLLSADSEDSATEFSSLPSSETDPSPAAAISVLPVKEFSPAEEVCGVFAASALVSAALSSVVTSLAVLPASLEAASA